MSTFFARIEDQRQAPPSQASVALANNFFVHGNRVRGMNLTVVFERCDEEGFHAFILEIPGAHSQGATIEEAKDNLLDALKELLSYRIEQSLRGRDVSHAKRLEAQLAA